MKIGEVLAKLTNITESGHGWKACCPAHGDQNPSLSVWENDEGHARWKCFAGCSWQQVGTALGIPSTNGTHKRIVAEYDYREENRNLLFQVCRFEPKDFRQRKPDGNGRWDWSTKDCRKVLYRLPDLLAADPALPVLIVEGEKDVDRLIGLGMVATTCPGGAGKWREEYSDVLSGRRIVVIPDDDDPGRSHAATVVKSLLGKARKVAVATLGGYKDISNMLDDAGPYHEEREVLERFISRGAMGWRRRETWLDLPAKPRQRSAPIPGIISATDLILQHPDLRPVVVDGLIRAGETLNLIAASKVGKSWLAHSLALSVSNGEKWLGRFAVSKGRVLLLDNELHRETLSYRLKKVSEATGLDAAGIDVLPLRGQLISYEGLEKIIPKIGIGRYALVIVDAHYRMLPTMSENDNQAVMAVYNLLDKYAAQMGAAWVLIHHASKGDQSAKEITDVGAGAGSQSRATDSHLILRKHENNGCHVLEGVTRSFAPPKPVVLRWNHPIWVPDDSLSPEQLETPQSKKRKREDDTKRDEILAALADGSWTLNKLARHLGMGVPRCEKILNQLINGGLVQSEPTTIRGNETTEYSCV